MTRHPWDCVVLLKGDEGLAPLGRRHRTQESACLLHRGTEMVHRGWLLVGQWLYERLAGDYSQGESSSEWLSEPSATRKASEEAGERKLSAPPIPPARQNLGKATPAEATLRIVVMDGPT